MIRLTLLTLTAWTLCAAAAPSRAAEWNVNAAGTGDFPTIQAAFDGASPGDRIILAPGTYRDATTRTFVDFGGHITTMEAVAFFTPGVTLTSSGGRDVTFIDGETARHCLVAVDVGTVELSGITMMDGKTNGSTGLVTKAGPGFVVLRSDPTVRECAFLRNVAVRVNIDGGGGLYLIQCPTADVRYNKFVDNFGGDLGGAMELFQVGDATVANNTFVRNEAGDRAGGLIINTSTCTLDNNIFAFNTAANTGGAIGCINGSVVTASCNVFWGNTAPVDPSLYLCSFSIGTDKNIEADPRFCAPEVDNFLIRSDSPAAPTSTSGCGLRGACPVGCGPVSVDAASWGRVKVRYR